MDKDAIIKDLTQRITSEDLPQGYWLSEREISEHYGISRTPVREILRTLSMTGLVEQQPGKGFRVRELKFDDIVDLFYAREAVETMATRLACKFGGESFRREVSAIRKSLEGVDIDKNVIKAMDLGRDIHDCIAEGSGNAILLELYGRLRNLVALTRIITRHIPLLENNSKHYHLKIIEAIENGDALAAETAMRDHLRLTCKLTINGYINLRTGFDDEAPEPDVRAQNP